MRKKQNVKKEKLNNVPSIIVDAIYYNQELSKGAMVLFGVLTFNARLSDKNEITTATWKLAKWTGRSTRAVQYQLSELYERNLIDIKIVGRTRIIKLLVLESENDVVSFIPPEVVANTDMSSTKKASYGALQYASANVNGHFSFTDLETLAEVIGTTKETARRHLKTFIEVDLANTKQDANTTRIYTFNSYQEAFKLKEKVKDRIKHKDPFEMTNHLPPLDPATEDQLRALVGR